MSSSNTKCQICAGDSHMAMECPVLNQNCDRCGWKMMLQKNGNGWLNCSRQNCWQTTTVDQVIARLNWKIPPPTPVEEKKPTCFHCGAENHPSLTCEWKNKKCEELSCPGMLFIRRVAKMESYKFGERYLQCEVCHSISWLDDLIRWRDQEIRKRSRQIREIVDNAKEKERKRRSEM